MKQPFLLIPFIILFACCRNNKPDVSDIAVDVKIERFDQYLFEKIDTNQLVNGLAGMKKDYPYFSDDFMQYFLGLPPLADTGWMADPSTPAPAKNDTLKNAPGQFAAFLRLTRPVYDSIAPQYKDVSDLEKELKKAFQYVKYYFPNYKVPKILTYIGPFDTPGVAVTSNAMAIGLQLFAGKNFSFYTSTDGQELYPMYISRRFERAYITPNCMKAVIEDLYPDHSQGMSLIEQMVEKGKRWYVINAFLPDATDSLITDYTGAQLKWADANEGLILNFILQGTDIYTSDPAIIKNFIGESPSTNGMPETSPGNIGQWVGWQIVKAYAGRHKEITPEALMKMSAKTIFMEAKYKPK